MRYRLRALFAAILLVAFVMFLVTRVLSPEYRIATYSLGDAGRIEIFRERDCDVANSVYCTFHADETGLILRRRLFFGDCSERYTRQSFVVEPPIEGNLYLLRTSVTPTDVRCLRSECPNQSWVAHLLSRSIIAMLDVSNDWLLVEEEIKHNLACAEHSEWLDTNRKLQPVLSRVSDLHLDGKTLSRDDCESLRLLPQLEYVHLSGAVFEETKLVPEIAGLESLRGLDLSNTKVTLPTLKTLSRLRNLEWLNIRDSGIAQEDVAKLRVALPEVRIYDSKTR